MPTEKPKITAYLTPALYHWLQSYQKSQGLKSSSKAVERALKEYSEMLVALEKVEKNEILAKIKQEIEQIRWEFNQRVEEVAQKVAQLEDKE